MTATGARITRAIDADATCAYTHGGARARRHPSVVRADIIMGATLTHPKPIDDLYFGNPVTDAETFAKAFAPDATLEFIGPYAPKDASGKALVIPGSELRAAMTNIIAGFSNFTVRIDRCKSARRAR
jgi:hypothetical protein